MSFSQKWQSLSREAQFAAESLAIRATALGNANYAHTAHYAQMLFSLSIGLERATKLAICLDHVARHGSYPDYNHIRKYGHNVQKLLTEVDKIGSVKLGTRTNSRLPNTEITTNIIRVLSDFGNNLTRYHNIDTLTGQASAHSYDPIAAWHRDVSLVVLRKHLTERQEAKIDKNARAVNTLLEGIASVKYSREDRAPITDAYTASRLTGLQKFETPYTRMYILQICRFVATVIIGISDIARGKYVEPPSVRKDETDGIPYMLDIFKIYLCNDKVFRSRKKWSIY